MKITKSLLRNHIFNYTYPILDTEDKFIYFEQSKVGTKSIRKALEHRLQEIFKIYTYYWTKQSSIADKIELQFSSQVDDKITDALMSYSNKELNKMFSFTVVRNPWDRIVSGFFYFHSVIKLEWAREMTFEHFVKNILSQYRENSLEIYKESSNILFKNIFAHLVPHYPKVSIDRNIFVDFVAKIETLDDDWKYICKQIDLEYQDLDLIGASPRTHYRDYYDEESKKIVGEVYKEDIEIFGYKY